jgi:ribosomal protein L32
MNKQDWESIQQPLAKDGFTNSTFDKLYSHKTKNPYKGTDRNRNNKKNWTTLDEPNIDKCPKCKGNKFIDQKICGSCFMKKEAEENALQKTKKIK